MMNGYLKGWIIGLLLEMSPKGQRASRRKESSKVVLFKRYRGTRGFDSKQILCTSILPLGSREDTPNTAKIMTLKSFSQRER